MKKKLIAAGLMACMCLNLNAAAFNDTDSHWARSFISRLAEYNIVDGGAHSFRPEDGVTAAEFLKMTLLAMGAEVVQNSSDWAKPYIDKAYELKLIYPDEISEFDKPITRGMIAKVVSRTIDANIVSGDRRESIINNISDFYDIDNEYKEYILAAYDNMILNGYEDNSFRVSRNTTRAEACVIVDRIIKAGNFEIPGIGGGAAADFGDKIYIAQNGGADGDGSEEKPFATLSLAQDKIRSMKKAGKYPSEGVTVYLRGGDYILESAFELGAEDSGEDNAPVVYTSYPGETARLLGSAKLEYSAFKPIGSDMASKLIDKSAASAVLETDLKQQGITDFGELSRRGYLIAANTAVWPELYINGSRMQLSRWPDSEWAGTAGIVRSGARSQSGVLEGAEFKIDYSRPTMWKTNIGEIYTSGVLGPNYFYGYFPIEKIAPGQITLREGSVTEYYSKHFIRYENVFEELSTAGEYYIDREKGKLYLYPTEDFGKDADIRLSMMTENMITGKGAQNIVLRNLSIGGTRASAVRFENAKNIVIENCEVSGTGANGIYINGENCAVRNSIVHDIGSTGIVMNGGDYANAVSAGNRITNNRIYKAAQIERSYQTGITLGYRSVGAYVAHNEIYDMPHAAMIIYGPEHIVEYNDIHDAVKEFHDMDAIYMNVNQYPWERNVVIRRNYIHNLGREVFTEKQMNVAGVRTDNHGNGLNVIENVFYNIGYDNSNGIRCICAQGVDNVVKNNIFVDTAGTYEGEHSYNPNARWDLQKQTVKEIYDQWQIYNPQYSQKNPEVAEFFDKHYLAKDKSNIFKENVVVNIAFPMSTANHTPATEGYLANDALVDAADNIVTTADPGFENYDGEEFTLTESSTVYSLLPSFPRIDFENIGVEKNQVIGPVK